MDNATAQEIATVAREEALRVNCTFSVAPETHTKFEFIGIAFDLTAKRAFPSPGSVAKLTRLCEKLPENPSFRDALEPVGLALWMNYSVGRYTLCSFPSLMQWLATRSKEATTDRMEDYDQPARMTSEARKDLHTLARIVMTTDVERNPWLTEPPTAPIRAGTDASDDKAAVVLLTKGRMQATTTKVNGLVIETKIGRHAADIMTKEMIAACLLLLVIEDNTVINFCTDNSGVFYGLRNGHSASTRANVVLQLIYYVINIKNLRVRIGLVPSKDQIADGPSRHTRPRQGREWFEVPRITEPVLPRRTTLGDREAHRMITNLRMSPEHTEINWY
jgi:hypothetical protein